MLITHDRSRWVIVRHSINYTYDGESKECLPILMEYEVPEEMYEDTWKSELKTKMHAKEILRRKFGLNVQYGELFVMESRLDTLLKSLVGDHTFGQYEGYYDEDSVDYEEDQEKFLKIFNLEKGDSGEFKINFLNVDKYTDEYFENLDEAAANDGKWFGNCIILFQGDIDIINRAVNLTPIDPLKFIGADGYAQIKTPVKTTITNNNVGGNTNMNMMNNAFGRGFGSDNSGKFKMSMMGVAIKNNEGDYISYNPQNNQFINVMDFVFDMEDMFFKMPVTQVVPGDLIIHQGEAVYVCKVDSDGIKVVNPETGKKEEIVPQSNMMGFNFYTKVFSMLSMFGGNGAANPTGMNIGAMMLFGGMGKGSEGAGGMGGMMQAMMFSQMMGGGQNNMFAGMFGQPTQTPEASKVE